MMLRLVDSESALPPDAMNELSAAVAAALPTLDALRARLAALLGVAERKLAALRAADTGALQHCCRAEEHELQQLAECDRERAAALARLAQLLPAAEVEPGNLTQLAARLPEPLASRIAAKSAGIRPLAENLRKKNRLAAQVAQNLQSHLRAVLTDVAHAHDETVGYGRRGQLATHRTRDWVDAVG